jgi:hypothetical protein
MKSASVMTREQVLNIRDQWVTKENCSRFRCRATLLKCQMQRNVQYLIFIKGEKIGGTADLMLTGLKK